MIDICRDNRIRLPEIPAVIFIRERDDREFLYEIVRRTSKLLFVDDGSGELKALDIVPLVDCPNVRGVPYCLGGEHGWAWLATPYARACIDAAKVLKRRMQPYHAAVEAVADQMSDPTLDLAARAELEDALAVAKHRLADASNDAYREMELSLRVPADEEGSQT